MANTAFKGNPVHLSGNLPADGEKAPAFTVVGTDLADVNSADLVGKRVVLNIFPSVDTGVCATSVRRFNELAALSGLSERTAYRALKEIKGSGFFEIQVTPGSGVRISAGWLWDEPRERARDFFQKAALR